LIKACSEAERLDQRPSSPAAFGAQRKSGQVERLDTY
jgi:hypothetical protein